MNNKLSLYMTHFFCVAILICGANSLFAQSSTRVLLESGPSEEYSRMIEDSTEAILDEINRAYDEGEEFSFSGEPGYQALRELLRESTVRSERDTLRSYMIELSNGDYEVRKLFLQVGEQSYEHQELALIFNQEGELVDAHFAESLQNFERTLNRGIETDEQERERVVNLIMEFADAFGNKDMESIERYLGEEALIVTGSQAESDDEFSYLRLGKKEYLNRLQESMFIPNPDIDVRFEDIEVYRDAVHRDVYAVSIYQYWNTTYYSDEGYLVLVTDFSNPDDPKIQVRSWQPEPFEAGRYGDIDPDPESLALGITEIRNHLPGDTLKISDRLEDHEGYVTIIVETDDPDLLNIDRLKAWLDDGILEITNVQLDMNGIMEVGDGEIRIPFASGVKDSLRHVQAGIQIYDTAFLESYSGDHVFVLQRDNVFTLQVTSTEEKEKENQTIPAGDLILTSNVDSVGIQVSHEVDIIRDTLLTDDVFITQFEAGSYEAAVSKEGYEPKRTVFEITSGELTSIHVDLIPIEVTPNFYARNRIWVWAATAATTLATAAVIFTGPG
ncbi:MAG: hypothetical protein WED82_07680, partial [Balneolales bacterium]